MSKCNVIPINNPCPSYPDTKCVVYSGVNLINLDVSTNERLQSILQKIDAVIGASVAGTLAALTDVKITYPITNNQFLQYDIIDGKWENHTVNYQPFIDVGTTLQYWRGDKTWQTLNTSVVPESGNLYYTQARFNAAFSAKTTSDLTEGTNLYYTDARSRAAISLTTTGTSGVSTYNSSTGVFNIPDYASGTGANSILWNGYANDFAAGIINAAGITDGILGMAEDLVVYRYDAATVAAFLGLGTAAYSNYADFAPSSRLLNINGISYDLSADRTWSLTTSDISEGTNLYFTNTRSRLALGAVTPLFYNSSIGEFTIQIATSLQDGYLSASNWNTFNGKQDALGFTPENVANKSISTTLGTSNTLYPTQLAVKTYVDNAIAGYFILQGDWDAATNTPDITGTTTTGWAYRVSVPGNTNLGGITSWGLGDLAVKTATGWTKIDNSDSVTSVNGYTGAVVLTTDDISEGVTNKYWTNARTIASTLTGYASNPGIISSSDSILTAINKLNGNVSALTTGVSSVFGRTGTVIAVSGDYNTSQVTENTNLYYTDARVLSYGNTQWVRSVSGTVGKIFSSGGLNPVLTIDAAYNGQSSITNVGTLTIGTWNATPITDTYISSAATWNAKQPQLNGTGFIKASGTTISYDNSTYLTGINASLVNAVGTISNNTTGNAATATSYGGQTANFSTAVTPVNLVAQQSGGSLGVVGLADTRTWLGLGSAAYTSSAAYYASGSTVANSTLWNGYAFSFESGTPSHLMVWDGSTFKLAQSAAIQSFLGLGSYAYRSSGLAELSGATFTGDIGLGYNNNLNFGASPYRFRINRSSSGMLPVYFDDEYDNAASSVNFRMRTTGTPITALTILGSGNIGVNNANPVNAKLEVVATSGEVFRADAAGGAYRIIADQTGVSIGGTLDVTGKITGTAGGQDSDIRLKDFHEFNTLSIANSTELRNYTWKDASKGTEHRYGYAAQDIQKILPEAVYEVTRKGVTTLAVEYTMVHTVIIDEHTRRINELEAKVKQLEDELGR